MKLSRFSTLAFLASLSVLAANSRSMAASMVFNIAANGIQEVNVNGVSNGDPDGLANGTITLDNGTGSGTTGFATFSLTVSNIDGSLSAHHFHEGPPTTTGAVRLDFGSPTILLTGSSTSGTLSGTVTGLSSTQITAVLANPTSFYYNLHSTTFPSGAVRHQLVPEPTAAGLMALSILGLGAFRRRR